MLTCHQHSNSRMIGGYRSRYGIVFQYSGSNRATSDSRFHHLIYHFRAAIFDFVCRFWCGLHLLRTLSKYVPGSVRLAFLCPALLRAVQALPQVHSRHISHNNKHRASYWLKLGLNKLLTLIPLLLGVTWARSLRN
jgi:hypothetical protein